MYILILLPILKGYAGLSRSVPLFLRFLAFFYLSISSTTVSSFSVSLCLPFSPSLSRCVSSLTFFSDHTHPIEIYLSFWFLATVKIVSSNRLCHLTESDRCLDTNNAFPPLWLNFDRIENFLVMTTRFLSLSLSRDRRVYLLTAEIDQLLGFQFVYQLTTVFLTLDSASSHAQDASTWPDAALLESLLRENWIEKQKTGICLIDERRKEKQTQHVVFCRCWQKKWSAVYGHRAVFIRL